MLHLVRKLMIVALLSIMMMPAFTAESISEIRAELTPRVDGVKNANISLNGTWKFKIPAPEEFWKNDSPVDDWLDMPVPMDIFAEGIIFRKDEPFAYKKEITIPEDFKNQRVLLHFGAVHNWARVWVNGHYITTHQGGFTPWECDITSVVQPGGKAWVALEIKDLSREISLNGKALRGIGGITRDATLKARPRTLFELPVVSSPFDDEFRNATLTVCGQVFHPHAGGKVIFRLFDPQGKEVPLAQNEVALDKEVVTFSVKVTDPVKWDAEHPNLYRLEITSSTPGQARCVYSKRIGFRDIRFDDKHNLLINGKITKLRGANRHLCNPLMGKVASDEDARLDVSLAKEANINFFRTSHYPPGVCLLEHCDEQGIYVTVESAVVNVGKREAAGMEDDPEETRHFLSQIREMVLNYGSHPSAIVWSTCNESLYGKNFKASYDLVKELDPSRPVTASYQVREDPKHESYDIKSSHYPRWNSDFNTGMPTIHDEWIHVQGHAPQYWFHDPSGRDFWGRSLDGAWANLFESNGSAGGAIWNYIDDVTYTPDPLKPGPKGAHRPVQEFRGYLPHVGRGNVFGVARWGIIDEWRRRKPEFWNTKKAYSPVKILVKTVSDLEANQPLKLPVQNRFNHTDLNEIEMKVTYAGSSQKLTCTALAPREKGELVVPGHDWKEKTQLGLEFYDRRGLLIDTYLIHIGKPKEVKFPALTDDRVRVVQEEEEIVVYSGNCNYVIDMTTGLFKWASKEGKKVPLKGPYPHFYQLQVAGKVPKLHLDSESPASWKLESVTLEKRSKRVKVKGTLGPVGVGYIYSFGDDGHVEILYDFTGIPQFKQDEEGRLTGKSLEMGIKFQVDDVFDELSWERIGYWSVYPEGHMGAHQGIEPLFTISKPQYAQHPQQPWEKDVHDIYYQGVEVYPGKLIPNISKGGKKNIIYYSLKDIETNVILSVLGEGKNVSARFTHAADNNYYLQILDTLSFHLGRFNAYSEGIRPTPDHKGKARIVIHNQDLR